MGPAQPLTASQRPMSLAGFCAQIAHRVAQLLGERAHASITIVVKDGKLLPVRVERTYLPEEIAKG